MKIAYFDCFCGAAGDMIVGACLDAGASEESLRRQLETLKLDEVDLKIEKVIKNGISATRFIPEIKTLPADDESTKHHHHRPHRQLPAIIEIIQNTNFSDQVKQQSIHIFRNLARAEAKVHGTSPDKIHFHEVGAADAIMDIVGAAVALEILGVKKVYCSPLVVGGGTVECEHGVLPVPAPATAELIKGIEITPTDVKTELLTPTGAAVLTTLSEQFGPIPSMKITNIGYGAGSRDIPGRTNGLRVLIGDSVEDHSLCDSNEICQIQSNIDDATAELIGHVIDKLHNAGALDVYCTAVIMKKNRPGSEITVLCKPADIQTMENILFSESTTFGLRKQICKRTILARDYKLINTPYGPIRIKQGFYQGHCVTHAAEYDDCRQAAQKHNVPLKEVIASALAQYKKA
ncbi:MAG: nickel pincer cofactor biosynthesis protein LarC [Sedimentisphaerales bacterium]|nr:nickel pincer cofactor biosynthesis protein LarC [Sedimentisphaerales bacterium]